MTHPHSPTDQIADSYIGAIAALNPLLATEIGTPGYERILPDLSPDGRLAVTDLQRSTLRSLASSKAVLDDTDTVTVAAMNERLGLEIERAEAGEVLRELNVLASAPQNLREVFDLMPTSTDDNWSDIAARLAAIPAALGGYQASLALAATRGQVAAARQIDKVAIECVDYAGQNGFFRSFTRGAQIDSAALRGELAAGTDAAAAAYTALAEFLRTSLLPLAPSRDAVGRERYALSSRYFLGATVDLDETYSWGLRELARIESEMAEVADRIVPGGDLDAAVHALDNDPARMIHGKDQFRQWMQDLSDRTIAEMGRAHFDIPDAIRTLDCKIAPTTTGSIYYLAPDEDFTRPGSMWWTVPEGIEDFSTWREVTTVYHEGVPGHHLQCAQTAYRRKQLNRWRRMGCWVSGHGEGWALYAERLMAELGYLDEPGAYLGMLDGQRLRAARVVLDIGVHLQLPVPPELGRGNWNADNAWTFLTSHARMGHELLAFELNRYLGWPGQAPSYKIGERIWLELREQVRSAQGADFDLTAFHRQALDLGSLGLDVLRAALLEGNLRP
jgi:uncharacterized protein (DUF885 family)